MVMPEASISVPIKVEFAPIVVAAVGAQNTSQADAPVGQHYRSIGCRIKSSGWPENIGSGAIESYCLACGYIHRSTAGVTARGINSSRVNTIQSNRSTSEVKYNLDY